MATKTLIPSSISHLADQFRASILTIDLKTIDSPDRDTHSTSITYTTSSSGYELLEEDYIDRTSSIEETVDYLREIATAMNSAGYLNECIQIYTKERTSSIAAFLQSLAIQNLHSQVGWESSESFIKGWCRSTKICVKFIFPHEKQLCHQIFHHFENANEDACFVETVKQTVTQLLDTADALSSVEPSPETIFRFLDLYETFSSFLPLINDLFSSQLSESIRVRPAQLLPKLNGVIEHILSDFGSSVLQAKFTVHPIPEINSLPRYVMNYVRCMCDYKQTLRALTLSKPLVDVSIDFLDNEEQTPLSLHLTLIITRLLSNLEAKSKLYKEEPLGKIFILKNVDYIVGEIGESPELQDFIGEGYLQKLSSKLCQVKVDCLRLTFDKMMYCLRVEGRDRGGIFLSRAKKMTNRLNSFNQGFAKAHIYCTNLVVPDSQLVVDFRKTIFEKLKPAYSSFLKQLESVTGKGKDSAVKQHIKYSVHDLEIAIWNLFNLKCYAAFWKKTDLLTT